jgi:transposase InsO family protein
MVRWLEDRTVPDEPNLLRWVSLADRDYAVIDSILYRMRLDREGERRVWRPILVVPELLREVVITHYHHSESEGGHMGVRKTFLKMNPHFWWPGSYLLVKQIIDQCVVCQTIKGSVESTQILGRIQPTQEFDVIGMDILSLTRTVEGFKYVLVAVDHFTRFAWVRPLKDKGMDSVLAAFIDMALPASTPRVLVTDNGTEFKNERFAAYCTAFNIHHHFIIPYHPQSDGVVERFNGTLVMLLRAYVNESASDWTNFLQKVCAVYNSTPHQTNGASPFHLLYKLRPSQKLLQLSEDPLEDAPQDVEQLRQWLIAYRDDMQKRTDAWHNSDKSAPVDYQIGDLVWCLDYEVEGSKIRGDKKLNRRWCGPWVVTAKSGQAFTARRLGMRGMLRRTHPAQMSRCRIPQKTPLAIGKEDEPEIPDITVRTSQSEKGEVEEGDREDGEEYLVESIVGHYLSEAGLWFLVKWSAYDDLTWEPEENLNCGHLVQQYFRRFK